MEQTQKFPQTIFLIKLKIFWQSGFGGLCKQIYLFILVYFEGSP
jgi:hypothetical protein